MSIETPLFENPKISLEQIPSVEDLVFEPLHPAHRTVRTLTAGMFFLFLLILSVGYVVLSTTVHPIVMLITGIVLLGVLWNVIYQNISFKYLGYALREKDITFQSGMWWKDVSTTPYDRVQHVDIKQGLLDRKFGIVKLTIYTAGGSSTDLEIPGLTPVQAQHIKEFILQGRPIIEESSEEE